MCQHYGPGGGGGRGGGWWSNMQGGRKELPVISFRGQETQEENNEYGDRSLDRAQRWVHINSQWLNNACIYNACIYLSPEEGCGLVCIKHYHTKGDPDLAPPPLVQQLQLLHRHDHTSHAGHWHAQPSTE